jgi:phosphatidylserine/phosphatidylglycerophosphate/cardiolipin synthase-like enzyme
MIEEKRLKVRVYTKGRLHAKAYIFDYQDDGRYEKGIGIVGSSNLSLSGISHNTELNVVVQGNDNHAELSKWFNQLWDEAKDFDATLMDEIKQSWVTGWKAEKKMKFCGMMKLPIVWLIFKELL